MLYKDLTAERDTSGSSKLLGPQQVVRAAREHSIPPKTVGRLAKTALHQAIIDSRYRQVKLLLANGSDVNAKDGNGWTPLMLSCTVQNEKQSVKMMKMFLKHGAEINIHERMGRTCLMIACMTGRADLVHTLLSEEDVELLAQDNDGNTALMHIAKGSQASALSAMLVKMVRYGLNVDTRNHLGYTALLLACKAGSYQNALELIRKGQACPYLRDHEFRFSAKDWLLRYESNRRHKVLKRDQFPHLMKVRSLTMHPSTERKKFDPILERLYTPVNLARVNNECRRANTDIPILPPHLNSALTQDMDENLVSELLRVISTAAENPRHTTRPKSIYLQNGRVIRNRKREISTAVLRSVTPRLRHSQQTTLHNLFQLYERNYIDQLAI